MRTDPIVDLQIQVLRLDAELPMPAYAHPGDAGADLLTAVDVSLAPGERCLAIVNTPGTIDAGYRGEIKVLLINLDPREEIELRRGDRVAQLVVQRFEHAGFVEVDALPESVRGAGGYGSTGGFGPS